MFRLLANAPLVFEGRTQTVDELLDSSTFTARTRELVVLRVAALQESSYELDQHTDVAKAVGLTDAQIEAAIGTGDLDTSARLHVPRE